MGSYKNKILLGILVFAFYSCNSYKKIVYFQDIPDQFNQGIAEGYEISFKPNDQLYIFVSSNKNPELAMPFNLSSVSYLANSNMESGYGNYLNQSYSIDSKGDIQFPHIGGIHVAGLSRSYLQDTIAWMLKERSLLKDPIVTVMYCNFKVSVLGEVSRPGSYPISSDRVTLLDAISMAGDLTIYGKRGSVTVVREDSGVRTIGKIDLRSKEMFQSPYFYLQQNDVIYIEPNRQRTDQSYINQNNNVGVWVSILSFLSTLVFFAVSR